MHDVLKDRYCRLMMKLGTPLYNPDDDASYAGPVWEEMVVAWQLGMEEGRGEETRRYRMD